MYRILEDEDLLTTIIKIVPYMQVVLLSKVQINAKNGNTYFLYKGMTPKGDTIEAFLNDEQESDFGVPSSAIASQQQIDTIFKQLPVVDVQFNQRGRLDTIQID